MQDQCDSLQAGTEAPKDPRRVCIQRRDARIAELETELKTYIKADTTKPELSDEQVESPSARSRPDPSIEQTVDTIAIIEVFRDGVIDQVMNLADVPSRIMIGRGEDCELRLDSQIRESPPRVDLLHR